jgi:hypothetical protein
MKKLLLMCAFVVIASNGANSQPSYTCAGLYADDAHTNNMWVWYTGSTTEFDMWAWWLPSSRGLHAVTFQLWIPQNVVPGTITLNPNAQALLGCNGGVEPYCATFLECQFDWVWSHRQRCYLMNDDERTIWFRGNPQAALCDPGYPTEDAAMICGLIVNYRDAVEPQTWGAIKSLYR